MIRYPSLLPSLLILWFDTRRDMYVEKRVEVFI